jgi:tetratricopeptide (TPR) repeat protein
LRRILPVRIRLARRAVPAAFCVLAFFALACASDEEKIADRLELAAQYRGEGNHREETLALRSALQLDPQNAELNRLVAKAYAALGRPEQATFYFGEAYRLDPSLTSAALAQVTALSVSDPEAADALIDEVLEREPDNARAHARRAELALLQLDTDTALAAALTAVELAPEDVLTHRALANVYRAIIRDKGLRREKIEDSLYESALASLERAEQLPDVEVVRGAWHDRREKAFVYGAWRGHEEEAKQAFREAFEMALAQDQVGGAREVARQAVRYGAEIGDDPFLHWALERRVEVAPASVVAWAHLAERARADGESWEAVWQRALEERPDDLRIHGIYVRQLVQADRYDEAIAHVEQLPPGLAELPDVPALLVELNLEAGRPEAAREAFARLREQHEEHALTRLAAARIDLGEGRVVDAVESLRALSLETERADVFRMLARGELRLRNNRAALAAANRALELDPLPGPGLLRVLMQAQSRNGDWQACLATFRELRARRFPLRWRDLLMQARALYATGKHERARDVLTPLIAPEGSVDPVLLFAQYETDRDPARVRELLEESLAHRPRNQALLRALTKVDIGEGHPERALERFETLGSERPLPPGLRLLRAKLLGALGRLEEAEREALAVFEENPSRSDAADLLVQTLEAQGKPDEAIARLEKARESGVLKPRGLWLLGRLYLDRGDLERSRAILEETVAGSPGLHVANNDLAFVLAEMGDDIERALDLARQAKEALPESPAVSDTLGYVYYRRGLLDPAVSELRTAIDGAKARGEVPADFHYHLGLALKAMARNDEAIRQFDAALAIQPTHAGASDARREISSSAEGGADS